MSELGEGAARNAATRAGFANELAGEPLNAFMAWWHARPTLNFVEAKVGYFDVLLAEATRVERERDGVRADVARLAAETEDLAASIAMRTAQLQGSRAELNLMKAERDRLRGELSAKCEELERSRSWEVARDDYGLICGWCDGSITRGQAVEPMAGTKGTFIHVSCPPPVVRPTCPIDAACPVDHLRDQNSPPNSGAGPREEPS